MTNSPVDLATLNSRKIGFVKLPVPMPLDFTQLISFYREYNKLDLPDAEFQLIEIVPDKFGEGVRIYFSDREIFFLPNTENQVSTFRSEVELGVLLRQINSIPNTNEYALLKSQLMAIYDQVQKKMSEDFLLKKQENVSYKQAEQKIKTRNEQVDELPIEFAEFRQHTIQQTISAEEITKAAKEPERFISVPERGYAIQRLDDRDQYIGTAVLGSCIGIIAINKNQSLVGVAHLDGKNVTSYEASLREMFAELRGSSDDSIELYMLGGDCKKFVIMPEVEFISKTLGLSILEFTKQYNVHIAGINLFKGHVGEFLVKINNENHSILAVPKDKVGLLTKSMAALNRKNFEFRDETAIDHIELTRVTPKIKEVNLMQTPIKNLSVAELRELRAALVILTSNKDFKSSKQPKIEYLLTLLSPKNDACKNCNQTMARILNEILDQAIHKQLNHSFILFKGRWGGSDVVRTILQLPPTILKELDSELLEKAKLAAKNKLQRMISKDEISEPSDKLGHKK